MRSLGMGTKTYKLTTSTINTKVENNKIGVYAFGHIKVPGIFKPKYIGRSGSDLTIEMLQQYHNIAANDLEMYSHFKFAYKDNEEDAYNHECINYHDFYDLLHDNEIHPAIPSGRDDLNCPKVDCDYRK